MESEHRLTRPAPTDENAGRRPPLPEGEGFVSDFWPRVQPKISVKVSLVRRGQVVVVARS